MLDKTPEINEILYDSLFYPASGLDGGVIKFFSKKVTNFIFCDYNITKSDFLSELNKFTGYQVNRKIKIDWDSKSEKYRRNFVGKTNIETEKEYAYLIQFKRKAKFSEEFGPKLFNLFFICDEGINVYNLLYTNNKIAPKYLAIIQSGFSFGNNWTNFSKNNGNLYNAISQNKNLKPEYIIYGGIGKDYKLDWNNFDFERKITPYYYSEKKTKFKDEFGEFIKLEKRRFGEITIWKNTKHNTV